MDILSRISMTLFLLSLGLSSIAMSPALSSALDLPYDGALSSSASAVSKPIVRTLAHTSVETTPGTNGWNTYVAPLAKNFTKMTVNTCAAVGDQMMSIAPRVSKAVALESIDVTNALARNPIHAAVYLTALSYGIYSFYNWLTQGNTIDHTRRRVREVTNNNMTKLIATATAVGVCIGATFIQPSVNAW